MYIYFLRIKNRRRKERRTENTHEKEEGFDTKELKGVGGGFVCVYTRKRR